MDNNYIEDLVINAKKGDKEALINLFEEFNPLIFGLIKRTYIAGYEVEDLKNECYLILLKCLKIYDPTKHRFTAYATNAIKNGFYHLIRNTNSKRIVQINDSLTISGNLSDYNLSNSVDTENDYINKCEYDILYNAISTLSPCDKHFIFDIFFNKIPLVEYAKINNLAYSTVVSKKRCLLKKLKQLLISTKNF